MTELSNIVSEFFSLEDISTTQLASGHIQITYLIEGNLDKEKKQFILQKINTSIFPHPDHLVENHQLLSTHLNENHLELIIPKLIFNRENKGIFQESDHAWRAQEFIPDSTTFEHVKNERVAYEGAKMVGQFTSSFLSLDPSPLHQIIPGFHNLLRYLKEYHEALDQDAANRKSKCRESIEVINQLEAEMTKRFATTRNLPDRVCHNDTKISNILFDSASGNAIKIIDLDTVMAEKVIYDYGDMVRSFLSLAGENEEDLDKITLRDEVFEAMTKGFLSETKEILTPQEKEALYDGGILITFEQAVRFLADYLRGDTYYQVKNEMHNLVRTKNQLHLIKLLLAKEEVYTSIINNHST